MSTIPREEAQSILDKGHKALDSMPVEEKPFAEIEELVEELEKGLETGDFEEKARKLDSRLKDIDESIIKAEPEMSSDKEDEAREEGPREEEYSNLSR